MNLNKARRYKARKGPRAPVAGSDPCRISKRQPNRLPLPHPRPLTPPRRRNGMLRSATGRITASVRSADHQPRHGALGAAQELADQGADARRKRRARGLGRRPASAASPARNARDLYSYDKALGPEKAVHCLVSVYPIKVEKLRDNFPEAGQRKRKWFRRKRPRATWPSQSCRAC